MLSAGFEPEIPATKLPQTYPLNLAGIGIAVTKHNSINKYKYKLFIKLMSHEERT
jgi:hypothetical protein